MLPIIVPVSLIPVGINDTLTALLLFSLGFGGVPYLLMCVGVIVWARRKNEIQLRKLSYVIPVIFVLFSSIFYLVFLLYKQGMSFNVKEFFYLNLALAGYGIGLGYFYVILVNIIYELFLSKYENHPA